MHVHPVWLTLLGAAGRYMPHIMLQTSVMIAMQLVGDITSVTRALGLCKLEVGLAETSRLLLAVGTAYTAHHRGAMLHGCGSAQAT